MNKQQVHMEQMVALILLAYVVALFFGELYGMSAMANFYLSRSLTILYSLPTQLSHSRETLFRVVCPLKQQLRIPRISSSVCINPLLKPLLPGLWQCPNFCLNFR
jgi:hypothetical protein